jgi:CubicO group peptidase (beta-lactamase class C family)
VPALLIALLAAFGQGGNRPTPPDTSLQSIVDSVRQAFDLPALGGAIVTLDSYAVAVSGRRMYATGQPVTEHDTWHLGSNLKAQTAALAAITVDAGKLSWSTTVTSAFPELAGHIRAEYASVTLEDLLAQRSGLPKDPPPSIYVDAGPDARAQRNAVAAWGLAATPEASRGSYHYSNIGYIVAGAMIERAWHGTYEALMEEKFWKPIGVTSAGWGPNGDDEPVGHRRVNGHWEPAPGLDNPPGLSSAGRAHMTLADWARVVQELMKADAGTSTLISAASGRKLTTGLTPLAGTDTYALGWIATTRPWAGGRVVVHDGSNTVNHSVAWVGLGNGLAFLAVTNAYDPGGKTAAAMDALVARMLTYRTTGR